MARAVVHLDVDCFYAQVEMLQRQVEPSTPLAVRQKEILVTCNYAARAKGLRKLMPLREGLRLCPELVVVPGEDLRPYRRASDSIAAVLRRLAKDCPVEKLGLDETFLDVTEALSDTLCGQDAVGERIPGLSVECSCAEGVHRRLEAASRLAAEIRQEISNRLGYSCCAGIAHNKPLAKLVGSLHRPNRQTIAFPCEAEAFMSTVESVRSIPGIGSKTAAALRSVGVESVHSLQRCEKTTLEKTFGTDVATKLKKLSLGADDARVKPSGRPLVVGIEDSFKAVNLAGEVEQKFRGLLLRLTALMEDDGRRPGGIKVTLRQISGSRTTPHRETRQCNLPCSLFTKRDGCLRPTEGAHDKLMNVIMRLFHKSVNMAKPFHLTLLGLAFTKFRECETGKSSIANYLIDDVSVQSAIDLQSEAATEATTSVSSPMSVSGADVSDDETEPSPKKLKWLPCSSPNRLRVAELNLNTPEKDQASPMSVDDANAVINSDNEWDLPPDVDRDVFLALPTTMQEELRLSWKCSITQANSRRRPPRKEQHDSIARYFIQNK